MKITQVLSLGPPPYFCEMAITRGDLSQIECKTSELLFSDFFVNCFKLLVILII